ncbi:unnamed protein product, partial [Urochloa humidicola]
LLLPSLASVAKLGRAGARHKAAARGGCGRRPGGLCGRGGFLMDCGGLCRRPWGGRGVAGRRAAARQLEGGRLRALAQQIDGAPAVHHHAAVRRRIRDFNSKRRLPLEN